LRDIDTEYLNVNASVFGGFGAINRPETYTKELFDYTNIPVSRTTYNERPVNQESVKENTDLPFSRPKFVNAKNAVPKTSTGKTNEVQVGATIKHERFGIGKVTAVSGDPDSRKATVEFENSGVKQLLLKFAKFDIIG
jgi:DNA helicase-2/ATP-dependent DNA helicase PcrA